MVRSTMQILIIGSVLLWKRKCLFEGHLKLKLVILLQGFLGGLMIICSFSCVLFMPLGDALTLIFSNPLTTMILAAIFLGHKLRLFKITFGLLLLIGIVLVVRPPFIFSENKVSESDSKLNKSLVTAFFAQVYRPDYYDQEMYYIGAAIAGSSAIISGLLNIAVNYCREVNSLVLLFWSGVGGLLVSLIALTFDENARYEIKTCQFNFAVKFRK